MEKKITYNPDNHLVIINNEIQNTISSFQVGKYKTHIIFKNNPTKYSYKSYRVEIYSKLKKNRIR